MAVAALWAGGGGSVDVPWAPVLDLRLELTLDGLGALYSLLAAGVGLAVFAYSARYLPLHLAHQGRHARDALLFYALLTLFMVSMIGLATAQDLILLFVFWDITAIASYFLIAFDRQEAASRWAALMALMVTGISAVALLIGALILYAEYGTFSLPLLFERMEAGTTVTVAAGLMAAAGLAKSAQAPLHFWLPRAMTAPTPVSAYLHSAAMVAAGVLLIGRLYPFVASSQLLLDCLLAIGALSIVVGGILALTRDDLKQVLAYSTISQYGYVVVMYGLGGAAGVVAASFYVIAHALAKSALFLTAGAVTEATGGERALTRLGGLARRLPLLAVASAIAVASVVALPLTAGFFGDELFFKAAVERGWPAAVAAVGAAALTFAYLARFWIGIFLGPLRSEAVNRLPALLVVPIAALAALLAVGGVWPGPIADLAGAAAESSLLAPASASVAYHLDLRAENLMALAAWALGATLVAAPVLWRAPALAFARLGERLGPERLYGKTLGALNRLSDRIHDIEVRDLRTRVAAVLLPGGILVALGFAATPTEGAYIAGAVTVDDLALVLVLTFVGAAAVAATRPRNQFVLVLTLAAVGFGLAAVYALAGAPDVALVAVLVETVVALLFLGAFALLPREALRREQTVAERPSRRWRDPLIATVSGLVVFVVVWGALSRPAPEASVAEDHIRLAESAHAKDVVTAIIADFRGLDTLGEVTVVAVALLGVAALLRRGRLA